MEGGGWSFLPRLTGGSAGGSREGRRSSSDDLPSAFTQIHQTQRVGDTVSIYCNTAITKQLFGCEVSKLL